MVALPGPPDPSATPTLGFPHSSFGKVPACKAGDLGLIPGSGRSPGEGNGHPLHYSGLENSRDYSPWGRKRVSHDLATEKQQNTVNKLPECAV